jgi:hypothetical protein
MYKEGKFTPEEIEKAEQVDTKCEAKGKEKF